MDTTLVATSDGVRPRATATGVVFPTGSTTTDSLRLRLRDGDAELKLGLPGRLTTPVLDGATATYRDVFPGVDLKLTATPEGMQQVYVVRTRAAARSGVMERLDFSLDSRGGRLIGRPGAATVFLDDKGNESLASGSAVMWDSFAAAGSDEPTKTPRMPLKSVEDAFGPDGGYAEHAAPSEGDRVKVMGVAVTDDRLRITPVAAMLNDPATVFPLYVDPFFALPDQERLMVRSPHDGGPEWKDWAFTTNEGVGLCPTSYSTECTGNYRKRLFFEFGKGTSALGDGHQVLKAEFRVHQTHHASCGSYTMLVNQANPISTSTTWPGSGFVRELASPSWGGCTNPDREVATEALRWQVQRLTNGDLPRLTIGLQAADETNQLAWKRFEPDAVISVYTALKPDVPSGLKVGDTFKGCGADAANAWYVNSQTPPVAATPKTVASDPAGVNWLRELKVQFQVESHLEDGQPGYYLKYDRTHRDQWSQDGGPITYWPTDDQKLSTTVHHRVRARTLSHYDNEGGEGTLYSGWTGWCYFRIDPDRPLPPIIEPANDYTAQNYPPEVEGQPRHWGGGIGMTAYLKYRHDDGDNDPNLREEVPFVASIDQAPAGTGLIEYEKSSVVTPDDIGPHTLKVHAYDRWDRGSNPAYYTFFVKGKPSVALWHVTRDGSTASLANTAQGVRPGEEEVAGPLELSGATVTGSSRGPLGRRGYTFTDGGWRDEAVEFATGGAHAFHGDPVVDTSGSFTFSTWAWLDNKANNRIVLSQRSPDGKRGIALLYRASTGKWAVSHGYDEAGTQRWLSLESPEPVTTRVWTHLAVSYDDASNRLTLVVNGRRTPYPAALTVAQEPTYETGPFQLGTVTGTPTDQTFRGMLDEVEVWDRSISQYEVTRQALFGDGFASDSTTQPHLAQVADWQLPTSTALPDRSAYARAALTPTRVAQIDSEAGVVRLSGVDEALIGPGPVIDETSPFTLSADFAIESANLSPGQRVRVAGQRLAAGSDLSSWALWYKYAGVDALGNRRGEWVLARTDADGTEQTTFHDAPPPVGEVRLNAVYRPTETDLLADPDEMKVCLHLGTTQLRCIEQFPAPSQGAGEIAVGKAPSGAGWTDWMTGNLRRFRVFAGAATREQMAGF
ncbi:LamG domain-containing protein [Nocardioides speluncae]|uniref:LamG domain-containing protein n=1 Tax=Nocardioides speluncae TaxID=2670337 RepID=UPI00137997EC|nr:LamG domain-containing protein [Nocardioides speluncae]